MVKNIENLSIVMVASVFLVVLNDENPIVGSIIL